jgi:mannose-6-phosphate isomerase-like protein (cupin superfamily)
MKRCNISDATSWFEVLLTTSRSQAAVMTLQPGKASGESAEAHEDSDQVLIVLEGQVHAEVGDEQAVLGRWDVVVIPAGVKHRFSNRGESAAVTFSAYAPPEYPPDEKG